VGGIAQFSTKGQTVRLPSALIQPIALDDVAAILADSAVGEPLRRHGRDCKPSTNPHGGTRSAVSDRDPRRPDCDHGPNARYYGIEVNDQSLTPGDNPRLGPTRFEEWLRRSVQ
jgi:hypothetical protein